jgi:hypothetical protein
LSASPTKLSSEHSKFTPGYISLKVWPAKGQQHAGSKHCCCSCCLAAVAVSNVGQLLPEASSPMLLRTWQQRAAAVRDSLYASPTRSSSEQPVGSIKV